MGDDASGRDTHGRGGAGRDMLLTVAEQRHEAARSTVAALGRLHPDADADELTNRLIRQCARELAIGGAVTGGAAASPVAGPTAAAAVLGTEGIVGVSRLGEMVMAIGIVHGHGRAEADERALWVAAALGVSEGAAMGMTGLAARAGARGGARLAARLPAAASATVKGAGRTRRLTSSMASKGGPWGLAALLPYSIGAGVGAAGNAALAYSAGRAAKHYFAANPPPVSSSGPGSSFRDPPDDGSSVDGRPADDGPEEIWDAEVVEERIIDP
jgi:hypothetical protein